MKAFKMSLTWLAMGLLTLSVALPSCGGGGGGGTSSAPLPTPTPTPGPTATPTPAPSVGTISGTAMKGRVANATVVAYAITTKGIMAELIGSGQTDGQGNFSISVGTYFGAVLLHMSGGTFVDEATGANMSVLGGDVMTSAIPSMTSGSTLSGILITPLTSMAEAMARGMSGNLTFENISAANAAVGNYFMVSDILRVQPMDPLEQNSGATSDQNMKNYGMAIAAMSQYANSIGMSFTSGMVTAMMNDASDGIMNGMMGNSPIIMGGGLMGSAVMPPSAGTAGLANAITQFIQSPMNRSGVTAQDMQGLINKLMTSNGVIH